MTHTVDASLWVVALQPTEPLHKDAPRYFRAISTANIAVIVPNIALLETACAVARRTQNAHLGIEASRFIHALHPHIVHVTMDLAEEATVLGCEAFLRAADAVYLAVALRTASRLVTADREMAQRGAPFVDTIFLPQAVVD